MEVAVKYSREEINAEIPYGVIVENWDKRLFGKGKRRYHEEFTSKEIMSISGYYSRFYKWYLITGVPPYSTFLIRNIELLKRTGDFFASL